MGKEWKPMTLKLTAQQRKWLWRTVDGAMDAGACEGGLEPAEHRALSSISARLLGVGESDDEPEEQPSQPPAGDDLVARLREGVVYLGNIEGDVETYDIDSANELMRKAAEALTSQQHTEPVAGEVEVVAYRCRHDRPFGGTWQVHQRIYEWDKFDITEPLVRKSSYDALAAAKDATIAECERQFQEQVQRTLDEMHRAEAAERQRDALREALTKARDYFKVEYGKVGQIQSVSYANEDLRKVVAFLDAALKDEGGTT